LESKSVGSDRTRGCPDSHEFDTNERVCPSVMW